MRTLVLVFAVSFLAFCSCTDWVPEYSKECLPGCPKNLTFINNVDFRKVQGAYYFQYLPFPATKLGCDGSCWTVYYPLRNETEQGVNVCCQKDGHSFCNEALGSGKLNLKHDGRLIYSTQGQHLNAYYLDVQYDSYFIGYSCGYDENGRPYRDLYVLTRKPSGPPHFEEILKRVLDKNNIDFEEATRYKVYHKCCKYNLGCPIY